MGYSEQLQEAEQWTGVRYEAAPDQEVIERLGHQFMEATGCRWQPNYSIQGSPSISTASDEMHGAAHRTESDTDPTLAALATIRHWKQHFVQQITAWSEDTVSRND